MADKADHDRGLPVLIVTGASGLVGSNFIEAAKEKFFIYAIARRSQKNAGVTGHGNIRWLRCDIGNGQMVKRTFASIAADRKVDYLLHCAGYYDFTYRDCDEYERTNVTGTRNVLESCSPLGLKRFILASSLAVTDFASRDVVLTEESPADGGYPYARSKKAAEDLVSSYQERFPCTIARLAAVYSDWCEYAPLYVLLNSWLTKGWRQRFIAGRGETAIPYLHVQDLNSFWLRLIAASDALSGLNILLASPSGCVSHNELFQAAMSFTLDRPEKSVRLPIPLATAGIVMLQALGRITGRPVFERPWMMKYIDRVMDVDAGKTERLLGWQPKPRFHLMRRLLFLIENMKRNPVLWEEKNLAMAKGATREHPGLRIHNTMLESKGAIIQEHADHLVAEKDGLYRHYGNLDRRELCHRSEVIYNMLEASIRLGERSPVLSYARYLARQRFLEGIPFSEVAGAIEHLAGLIETSLTVAGGLEDIRDRIHHEITITMQLIIDEIEDAFDQLGEGES